jgi:hypothetical protein
VGALPALPSPGEAPKAASQAPAQKTGSAFAVLRDRLLDQWLADSPSFARGLGLHAFDGRVADFSQAAIERRIARLKEAEAALAAVDRAVLSPDEALDLALLTKEAESALFELEDLALFRHQPQFYEELFDVDDYLQRDYAPIEERARSLLAHEQAALAQVPNIYRNLTSPMSRSILETAMQTYEGYATYLREEVPARLAGVGTAAFQGELARTNAALAAEAARLAEHVKTVELPRADETSHVLGRERYQKLLFVQEGLTLPLAEFKRMGEEDLARNQRAYEAVAPKARSTRPTPERLLHEATRIMEAARVFVVREGLVTIPQPNEEAVVKESPPFMRWNAAYIDTPGPFEVPKAKRSFYYITPPDPSWPKREQEEYIPPFGVLVATTVHEVYPGHFLQNQWIERAPTRAQKILGSYSFIEGWAHYSEQLMIDQGFGAEDPQNRLGQLVDALLRDCRYLVSIGIHTEGMTLSQAEELFINACHQDRATARQQARRATFDPGYFAYTLGKLEILALREEARQLLGERFSLRRFHDELLSHGSPQVPLIRERVLKDLIATAR